MVILKMLTFIQIIGATPIISYTNLLHGRKCVILRSS